MNTLKSIAKWRNKLLYIQLQLLRVLFTIVWMKSKLLLVTVIVIFKGRRSKDLYNLFVLW